MSELINKAKENVPKVYESGRKIGHDEGIEEGYDNGLSVAIDAQEEFLADKPQTYYDTFWDMFQMNGERVNYNYAFAGTGFDVELMKPKYPIVPKNAAYMFAHNTRSYPNQQDYSEICKKIDLSKVENATSIFQNICGKNLTVDLSSCTSASNAFNCNSGGDIDNLTLKVTEKLTSASNMFLYNTYLTTLTFTEDSVIAVGLTLQKCPKLSKASIESVINALSTTTTGLTITLSKTAVNNAFTDAEWTALEATKPNWTISLI